MTQPTTNDKDKKERIKKELEAAGVLHRRIHPFTNNYLPRVIHDDEHIMAAVFGRRKESEGFFGFVEGMLVATDKRVIFLDHRPGYTTMDEVAYDKVSGVNISTTLLYSSIILYTKVLNYKISFANYKAAQQFADHIESKIVQEEREAVPDERPAYVTLLNKNALDFLAAHEIGVLSSIERTGVVSGAVIYYAMLDGYIYFITKKGTHKADNIVGNQHIAFTVFDEPKLQTAQIQGIVEMLHDDEHKLDVLAAVTRPRTYADGSYKPPILRSGTVGIQIYRIVPTKFDFIDYSKDS